MTRYQGTEDEAERDENATSTREWWDARAARMAEEIAADRAYADSETGRLHRASVAASAAREIGDAAMLAKAEAELDALAAERKAREAREAARFAAEWTLEVTQERRAAWNARVRSGEFGQPGRMDGAKISAAYRAQGWNVTDLANAVKLRNLGPAK